jgi:hypothetical protein
MPVPCHPVIITTGGRAVRAESVQRDDYVRHQKTVLGPDTPNHISVRDPKSGGLCRPSPSRHARDREQDSEGN